VRNKSVNQCEIYRLPLPTSRCVKFFALVNKQCVCERGVQISDVISRGSQVKENNAKGAEEFFSGVKNYPVGVKMCIYSNRK
jgi:hypothetical protein